MWLELGTSNPYLNVNLMNDQFIEAMKAQERTAISAILTAEKAKISNEGKSLTQSLNQTAEAMNNFASNGLASRLKEGFWKVRQLMPPV
jgi:CHASE3 domain sensor protein